MTVIAGYQTAVYSSEVFCFGGFWVFFLHTYKQSFFLNNNRIILPVSGHLIYICILRKDLEKVERLDSSFPAI